MELEFTEQNSNHSEILYSAELIANTFADALKQNNCMLMLTVGLHQEINDVIKDVTDLNTINNETNIQLEQPNTDQYVDDILDVVQSAIDESKARCYSCKLSFPSINFDMNFDVVMGRLSALLDVYKQTFTLGRLDLCQTAYALRNSCLPDILRLIILLLTAYASIMMLKNIGSISVLAFIKGVISTIISKIFSTLKISVNIGSSNIQCIITALQEIANSILPTEERIMSQLDLETKAALDVSNTSQNTFLYNQYVDDLDKGLNKFTSEINSIEDNFAKLQRQINETFGIVTDVMKSSTDEVNNYIQSMFSLKTTFECEAKRSGTDVEEVLNKVNKLIQVLNLLSAVALSIAKKEAREKICSTGDRISDLSENEVDDVQLKDVIEEYYEQEADLIENEDNGIQIIIYDKPKESTLPKLSLLDCSIDDFIESHSIDNIIKIAEEEVKREINNPTQPNRIIDSNTVTIGKGNYILPRPSDAQLTGIDNIVNILYQPPSIVDNDNNNSDSSIEESEIENIIGKDFFVTDLLKENSLNTDNKTSSLNCKSIDDVMSVLNKLRRN